ncbi:hypothetical protein [Thiothrix winogradskyi]|uniref:Uncharacterized protein n=1 Tax=Thiothrix winogradskyi TaxID=96472 RepID=A0ABY3T4D2_9GAMM|nr:hypothetical protein [Thiothrix winogradskyi]UJS26245.1 hypothetical protein L2Y54_09460 [Thiothrix winogradskyi]
MKKQTTTAMLDLDKLTEAADLAIAILDDLETEIEWPGVATGMAYRAALDNAKQLVKTLEAAGEATPC